jgi:elongator complex protein 3
LLRLRIFGKHAVIRELHVYGEVSPLGERQGRKTQHTGLGQRLLNKAEQIVQKHRIKKLSIISGIGAREYYQKLGYQLEKTYMIKSWQ